MIELPTTPAPNGVGVALIDYGLTLRPSTGAATLRVDRKGSRYQLTVGFPPMEPATAAVFIARILKGKREGLRIPFPLTRGPQGTPGSPVVDGAGQSGTTLNVRGFTASYPVLEGYWFSIVDASGQHYLHNVSAAVTATAGGLATLSISPELRVPFADAAVIHFATPMVEGFVDGNWGWDIPLNTYTALEFTMEEAA